MVGDLRTTDPSAQLRIAFADVAFEVTSVDREDSPLPVLGHANVAVAVLFVERLGEGMDDPAHHLPPFIHSSYF